jgi:LmbE family N-acetylglucosaminyl deacetylase
MGASHHHFQIPDAIYRGDFRHKSALKGGHTEYFYQSRDSLFGPLHPAEGELAQNLSRELLEEIRQIPNGEHTNVVCPLAIGNHIDHQLTRQAVEHLEIPLLYYADFPYAMENLNELDLLRASGWRSTSFKISQDALGAWCESIAAHKSQLSTFWAEQDEMCSQVESYLGLMGGAILWQPPA